MRRASASHRLPRCLQLITATAAAIPESDSYASGRDIHLSVVLQVVKGLDLEEGKNSQFLAFHHQSVLPPLNTR
jgi:hypothetical protein